MIDLYTGRTSDGTPAAFFSDPVEEIVRKICARADAIAGVPCVEDARRIDPAVAVRRVGAVDVVAVDDGDSYLITHADEPAEDQDGPAAKPATGRAPQAESGAAVVQSLVFDKAQFTPAQARAWIRAHREFGDYGMEETENSLRFRQYDPSHFTRFRMKELTGGIQAVYGIVKAADAVAETDADGDIPAVEKAHAAVADAVDLHALNAEILARGLRLLPGSIAKADPTPAEERYVLSLVLEPNDGKDGAPFKPDTQKHVYSAADVRKTAHGWMERGGKVDLDHSFKTLGEDAVRVLESYLAPVAFSLGEDRIVAGTWMLALRIRNDELWAAVKRGEIGAFSIGGTAQQRPYEAEE